MKHSGNRIAALSVVFAAQAAMAEGDIPQMDPTWYPNQLLWLGVSFTLLFIVVSRLIVPSIHAVLHTRESAISNAIAEAERARSEAESSQGQATGVSQTARVKAAELMAAAQAETSLDATKELAKLDRELAKKAGHAEIVLQEAVHKAEAGIEEAAQQLAMLMADQLLAHHHADTTDAADGPKLKLAKR